MLTAILGGVMIGSAAGVLMLARGRIAGIGGMVGGLVSPNAERDTAHRIAFLVGLLLAGSVALALHATTIGVAHISLPAVAIGGVLVGYGVQRGSGCTSGHGVCGIARFSLRSLVATLTFMATGALTVLITHHLWVSR